MPKINIEDLTPAQLDEWTAKARGWEKQRYGAHIWWYLVGSGPVCDVQKYHPTTNREQWAELIVAFQLAVTPMTTECECWTAMHDVRAVLSGDINDAGAYEQRGREEDGDPGVALCRAVIASVYGDSVEVME